MELTIKNLQKKVPIPRAKIIRAVKLTVKKVRLPVKGLSINFVGYARMCRLNRKYLKHDGVTDILTFNLGTSADIIICPTVAATNACRFKTSISHELVLYVIHGLLHLAGFNDHTPAQIKSMRAQEQRLMVLL